MPLVDLGATPPWSASFPTIPESALRSTLFPTSIESIQLGARTAIDGARSKPSTALSRAYRIHPPHLGRGQPAASRSFTSAPTSLAHADVNGDAYVDTENNRDGVYMINAAPGSWSGFLPSESHPAATDNIPIQARLAIAQLTRAEKLAAQSRRLEATNAAMAPLFGADEPNTVFAENETRWKKDLLLRNTVRHISAKLQQGAMLTLEKMKDAELDVICSHSHCPAVWKVIPVGAYYCTLGKDGYCSSLYCLLCLQGLWNGKDMGGALPHPGVKLDDRYPQPESASMNLDGINQPFPQPNQPHKPSPLGQVPPTLLTSKHATSFSNDLTPLDFEAERPPTPEYPDVYNSDTPGCLSPAYSDASPPRFPPSSPSMPDSLPSTPGLYTQSPASLTSSGQWRHPPTRFQWLAKFIQPGLSLNKVEQRAVKNWKTVSLEQTDWEEAKERDAARDEDGDEVGSDGKEDVDEQRSQHGEGLENVDDGTEDFWHRGEAPEGEAYVRPDESAPWRSMTAPVKKRNRATDLNAVLIAALARYEDWRDLLGR